MFDSLTTQFRSSSCIQPLPYPQNPSPMEAIALPIFHAKNATKLIADDAILGVHFCIKIFQPP